MRPLVPPPKTIGMPAAGEERAQRVGLVVIYPRQRAASRRRTRRFHPESVFLSEVQHPAHTRERQTVSYGGGDVQHLAAQALVYAYVLEAVLAAEGVERPREFLRAGGCRL